MYFPSTTHWLSNADRINFYLNGIESINLSRAEFETVKNLNEWNKKELRLLSYSDLKNTPIHLYCKYLIKKPGFRSIRTLPFFSAYRNLHSLMDFIAAFDKGDNRNAETKYPLFYGEHGATAPLPCLRKARHHTDAHSVIFNLRSLRHTEPCRKILNVDIPWDAKKRGVVWRGATTGQEKRIDFVKKYFKGHNVAFSTVKQKPEMTPYRKDPLSFREQLQYKFIVSLEGNELASNLRWVLSSNSVPIMTKPTWHSWIIEKNLVPNVHYLELNEDLSNLEDLLSWAHENNDQCKEIAKNGQTYMAQFLDERHDERVQKDLLNEFANRLTYTD